MLERDFEKDTAARLEIVFGPYPALMQFDNFPANGQTQPRAASLVSTFCLLYTSDAADE